MCNLYLNWLSSWRGISFNLKKLYYNYVLNPDSFMYNPYRLKRPGYVEALELDSNLCGVVGYSATLEVLKKKG